MNRARIVLTLDDATLNQLADLVAERISTQGVNSTAPASAYTTQTLGDELGVSERSIRGAIQRGDLEAVRRGRRYVISGEAVRRWATATNTSARRTSASTGPARQRSTTAATGTLTSTLANIGRRA